MASYALINLVMPDTETQSLKIVILLLALLAMSLWDLKTNRVSNTFVLIILFMSIGFAILQGNKPFFISLTGLLLGGGLFLIPYLLNQVGGADVKVFAVVGSCLGIFQTLNAFVYTLISGMLLIFVFKVCKYDKPNLKLFKVMHSNQTSILHKESTVPYLPAITTGTFFSIFLPLEWAL